MADDTTTEDELQPEQQVQLREQLPQTHDPAALQAAFERAVAAQMADLPRQEQEFRHAEAVRHPDWGDPDDDDTNTAV